MEMKHLINPKSKLKRLYEGTLWAEGPVWKNNSLIWSDVRSNTMHLYNPATTITEIFRDPSDYNNGNTTDLEGRLIRCQHGKRRVVREERDGSITVIADRFENNKFNSPNDVAVKSDGSIWFTDPDYGILSNDEGYKSQSEQSGNFVYRVSYSGEVEKVLTNFDKPNGIVFSPNEDLLYVADSGSPHNVKRYSVDSSGKLSNEIVFCDLRDGSPDGMTVDTHGNLYICDVKKSKIRLLSDSSKYIGSIDIPERVANCTFGGEDNSQLFITASTSLYGLKTETTGK